MLIILNFPPICLVDTNKCRKFAPFSCTIQLIVEIKVGNLYIIKAYA